MSGFWCENVVFPLHLFYALFRQESNEQYLMGHEYLLGKSLDWAFAGKVFTCFLKKTRQNFAFCLKLRQNEEEYGLHLKKRSAHERIGVGFVSAANRKVCDCVC